MGDRLKNQLRLPSGLVWKTGGLKYLVEGRLLKWKWVLPKLSYRGCVLIVNNLVSSALWHCLACVYPPASLLSQVQSVFTERGEQTGSGSIWPLLHPPQTSKLLQQFGGLGLDLPLFLMDSKMLVTSSLPA